MGLQRTRFASTTRTEAIFIDYRLDGAYWYLLLCKIMLLLYGVAPLMRSVVVVVVVALFHDPWHNS